MKHSFKKYFFEKIRSQPRSSKFGVRVMFASKLFRFIEQFISTNLQKMENMIQNIKMLYILTQLNCGLPLCDTQGLAYHPVPENLSVSRISVLSMNENV